MTKLLKPEEAAERLAVSPKAVRAWLREGRLPGIRLGRLWRISEAALERFIAGVGFAQDAPKQAPQVAPEQRTPPRETRRPKGPQKRATPQKRLTREDLLRRERAAIARARREREQRKRKGR